MKHRYFGDINDYRKYGLLRALSQATGLSLRKLPRQGHKTKGDFHAAIGLGIKVQGGTPPRLSCGRSVL